MPTLRGLQRLPEGGDDMTRRRIALLIELPDDTAHLLGMIALRRLLKCLLRSYGLKCLSIKHPSDTATFGSACEHPVEPKQASTLSKPQKRC